VPSGGEYTDAPALFNETIEIFDGEEVHAARAGAARRQLAAQDQGPDR
jgi:hypothetical protein